MFILQLVDNSKLNIHGFSSQTVFLGWIYAAHIKNVPEYKAAHFKNVTLSVNDFIKEDYVIRANKGYCGVAFRYDIESFLILSETARIKEINELYYRNLKLLFTKLQLPIEPLTEIYNKIIENNYQIPLTIIKQIFSKNKLLKAGVIIEPTIKSFDYYLLIQDAKNETFLQKVLLFKSQVGSTYFIGGVTSKIKWQDSDTINVLDKTGGVVYRYTMSNNFLEKVNESIDLKRWFV